MLKVEDGGIPHTNKFDFSSFMATDAKKREWQEKGLATDKFSTENGVFVS
jgi:dynein heavy chain